MNKTLEHYIKLAPFVAIGLVVVAIAVAGIFYMQRGAHIDLSGSILKVRTLAMEDNATAAVLDFRVTNVSDYGFLVRKVDASLVDEKGQTVEGVSIAEVDARRLFEFYPALGQKYNDTLTIRTMIKARQTIDRMLVVRFELPEKAVQARKEMRLRIEEINGPVAEISDRKP